jgi:hypothetical protein
MKEQIRTNDECAAVLDFLNRINEIRPFRAQELRKSFTLTGSAREKVLELQGRFPDLPIRDTGQRCELTLLGLFGTITKRLCGKRLAIVCDSAIYDPPVRQFCWIEERGDAGPGV